MNKAIICSLCLLGSIHGFSQDTATQNILSARDDSAKVIRLADYAYSFVDSDKEKARRLYDELMRVSKKLDYPYWIGMTWFNLGYMHSKEAKDREAIQDFNTALQYLEKTNRIDQVASCHLNIGAISERIGDIGQKINSMMEAIRLLEPTKYKDLLMYAYNGVGVSFYNMNDFYKGEVYFKKSIQIGREIKDSTSIISALYGVANCISSSGKFEAAVPFAKESLEIALATKNDYNLSVANACLSQLYRKWGKGLLAIEHARKSFGHAKACDDKHYQLIGLMDMADGYGLLKDHKKRIEYLNQALTIARESGTVLQLDDIYKGLSEAYEGEGNYQKALDYYKQSIVNLDSTNNLENRKNVAELEIRYQTAQKEIQLQKSRQYTLLSIGAALVTLLVAGLIFLQYKSRKKLHERQLQSLQKDSEIQQLHALMQGEEKERSRIAKDLHDGVAGMLAAAKMHLESVGSEQEAFTKDTEYVKGIGLLNDAAVELRKTSHNLMPEVLIQYGLDQAIRRYCNNINSGRTLSVEYNSLGKIGRFNNSFELSVYRIVQELLNNIVKHSRAKEAIVQVSRYDGILSITIEDNGVGFSAGKDQPEGMGLKSLSSRVKAINGKMELVSEPGSGVSAYLEFDLMGLDKK
ncbi:tetratricopeptide repeat protein [Flavihumibacter stibioxidans]|uniref:Histidine kinase domain-containing protein n=1 Tax=Flavihumibacter stibioxidans TaxID=1834163 RepID=A0ABR7MD73_9BACT|nr:sensor histidine kinase [Flavihumibacter stibioxidans]MBC6492964.1 hypothetical protein [Flavihumibacter stibioxidans]